jgi:hypothetical protein
MRASAAITTQPRRTTYLSAANVSPFYQCRSPHPRNEATGPLSTPEEQATIAGSCATRLGNGMQKESGWEAGILTSSRR